MKDPAVRAKTNESYRRWVAENRERVNAYRRDARRTDPLAHREYGRRYALKKNFGISAEEYEQMLASQDGQCHGCRRTQDMNVQGRRLAVDHCHVTGHVRGLLCDRCNRIVGLSDDNPDTLMALAAYLTVRSTVEEESQRSLA